MIVISDTSPLNYLISIEQENLLPQLFGRVTIPQAVFDESKKVKSVFGCCNHNTVKNAFEFQSSVTCISRNCAVSTFFVRRLTTERFA